MTRQVRADASVLGRLCRLLSHSRSRCASVRGRIRPRDSSVPVPVGVARPPARALARIDGEASTSSGHRPPGSNRPVRIDCNTGLTSTPSPGVGSSMPWSGVLSAGPERLASGRPP